jgi:hypothetical protein
MSSVRPRALMGLLIAVLLVMAAAVDLAAPGVGATGPRVGAGQTTSRLPSAHNRCKRSKMDVPACGVLWGMYTPPVPGPSHEIQPFGSLEKQVGRRFDIVKNYVGWGSGAPFPTDAERALAGNGKRILEFSWTAASFSSRAKVSYQSIAAGDWDKSVILPEARHLKHFHHKVIIDFNHEFDSRNQAGKGTPAQYVAAYRHIHQVMRRAGVRNVIWAWVSTGDLGHAQEIEASYPGPSYVNWVGFDPYNFAQCHSDPWRTPYQLIHPFYRWLRSHRGTRNKPIMLGEYGSAPGPLVEAWYAGMARALKRMPRIKAVMEWNSSTSSVCDFRLTDSAAAMAGFRVASNAPYIIGASR